MTVRFICNKVSAGENLAHFNRNLLAFFVQVRNELTASTNRKLVQITIYSISTCLTSQGSRGRASGPFSRKFGLLDALLFSWCVPGRTNFSSLIHIKALCGRSYSWSGRMYQILMRPGTQVRNFLARPLKLLRAKDRSRDRFSLSIIPDERYAKMTPSRLRG